MKHIELLHRDKFSITKYRKVKNEDGTTDVSLSSDPTEENLHCRLSKMKADEDDSKSIDVNNNNVGFKLFCSPNIKVQKGDFIVVDKIINGNVVYTVKGYAGQPVIYHINQEIVLKENKPE